MSQKLRGFVGQSMSGQRKALSPVMRSYSPGSYTLTPAKSGWYRFVLFGGGAGATNGVNSGPSGALVVATRQVNAGQSVAITVGAGGQAGGNGASTTVTLPTGEVITAGGGDTVTNTGGVATGKTQLGDTLTNGTAGTVGAAAGLAGANAPSTSEFNGGTGTTNLPGKAPGAGGSTDAGSGQRGGDGSLFIAQTRLRI